ncbi:DUF2231 domain-containing protein [Sphingobium sp.]|uniref:DUF2231 domain-containing protein n=1 Tax=Sphingobium sp. TaxID=1912891 RepID=UPI002C79EC61|nr:DUF2231 domain-containing protein [Sphingobium sp.]HUD92227.1 DUF2231 domain-containing protein [Sphingobium sp.]
MPTAAPHIRPLLHPLHALLLSWPLALFPAALIADITYLNTAEIQWTNFAAWLITGALIGGGPALLWAIIAAFRLRTRQAILYATLLAAAWIGGLIDAFQHSQDGWSSVGTAGVALSTVTSLLVLAAGWSAHNANSGKTL